MAQPKTRNVNRELTSRTRPLGHDPEEELGLANRQLLTTKQLTLTLNGLIIDESSIRRLVVFDEKLLVLPEQPAVVPGDLRIIFYLDVVVSTSSEA